MGCRQRWRIGVVGRRSPHLKGGRTGCVASSRARFGWPSRAAADGRFKLAHTAAGEGRGAAGWQMQGRGGLRLRRRPGICRGAEGRGAPAGLRLRLLPFYFFNVGNRGRTLVEKKRNILEIFVK
jgi:hypothetical protein